MRYYALGNQKEALQQVIDAVSEMESEILAQSKEIQQLTKERDEARRMYCSMVENNARQYGTSAKSVAKQAGWDCFKETP